jgi:hypothetical protein
VRVEVCPTNARAGSKRISFNFINKGKGIIEVEKSKQQSREGISTLVFIKVIHTPAAHFTHLCAG